jgi:hypothetical protein
VNLKLLLIFELNILHKFLLGHSNFESKTIGNSLMTRHLEVIVAKIVGEFLFLFGLLGWFYGLLIQLVHPEWLALGLSHIIPWIRVDTFTIISFVIAAFGFLVWRLAKELPS